MSQDLSVTQVAERGAHNNTYIGEQNNYGLSVNDAMDMAIKLLREYYPKLREEALAEMRFLVAEKLKDVPSECIVQPNPRIAISVLQNASITEEPDVRELYANLLAGSMNSTVKDGVHPSFVEIVKQLSSDEAKILNYLNSFFSILTVSLRIAMGTSGHVRILEGFTDVPQQIGCENVYSPDKCFINLIRLGLVDTHYYGIEFPEESYEQLMQHPIVKEALVEGEEVAEHLGMDLQVGVHKGYITLTDYGKEFCNFCCKTRY